MAKTTYLVKMADGQKWTLYADMVQASESLWANFSGDEDGDVVTPYQTADAGHRIERAAELVAEYFAQPGDSTEVVSVEAR